MTERHLQDKARAALGDDTLLKKLLLEAAVKADANKSKIRGVWTNFQALVRMVQAWRRGQYKEVPWRSLLAAVAAILYFVNPFDLIPDFLLVGLVDDVVLMGWVLTSLRSDLNKFLLWERTVPVRAERVESG